MEVTPHNPHNRSADNGLLNRPFMLKVLVLQSVFFGRQLLPWIHLSATNLKLNKDKVESECKVFLCAK